MWPLSCAALSVSSPIAGAVSSLPTQPRAWICQHSFLEGPRHNSVSYLKPIKRANTTPVATAPIKQLLWQVRALEWSQSFQGIFPAGQKGQGGGDVCGLEGWVWPLETSRPNSVIYTLCVLGQMTWTFRDFICHLSRGDYSTSDGDASHLLLNFKFKLGEKKLSKKVKEKLSESNFSWSLKNWRSFHNSSLSLA